MKFHGGIMKSKDSASESRVDEGGKSYGFSVEILLLVFCESFEHHVKSLFKTWKRF